MADSASSNYQGNLAADCVHFMRTGTCRYGVNCRYNHRAGDHLMHDIYQLPERIGQPDCQFYLKTGTCKFGSQCKYHHPHVEAGSARGPPLLNSFGLPLRPDEKECAFYLRTRCCKFGVACKFHHPEYSPSLRYANSMSASSVSMPLWPITSPFHFQGSVVNGSSPYMPFYPPVPYNGCRSHLRMGTFVLSNGEHGGLYDGAHQPLQVPQALNDHTPEPERSECRYYLKTGHCKFGANCRYYHPKNTEPVCAYYCMNGNCRFGPTCRFDHPIREPHTSLATTHPQKEQPVKVDEGAHLPKSDHVSWAPTHPQKEESLVPTINSQKEQPVKVDEGAYLLESDDVSWAPTHPQKEESLNVGECAPSLKPQNSSHVLEEASGD